MVTVTKEQSRRAVVALAALSWVVSLAACVVAAKSLDTAFVVPGPTEALVAVAVAGLVFVPAAAALASRSESISHARVLGGVALGMTIAFAAVGLTLASTDSAEVERRARSEFLAMSPAGRAEYDNDPLVLRDAYTADRDSMAAVAIVAALALAGLCVVAYVDHENKLVADETSKVASEKIDHFRTALQKRRASAIGGGVDKKDIHEARARGRRGSVALQAMADETANVHTEMALQHRGSLFGSSGVLPGSTGAAATGSKKERHKRGSIVDAAAPEPEAAELERLRAAVKSSGADIEALLELCAAWKEHGDDAAALAAAVSGSLARHKDRAARRAAEAALSRRSKSTRHSGHHSRKSSHGRPSTDRAKTVGDAATGSDTDTETGSRRHSKHRPHPPAAGSPPAAPRRIKSKMADGRREDVVTEH